MANAGETWRKVGKCGICHRRAIAGWSTALVLLVAGCDAQVDPSYQGEPLLTISGDIGQAAAALLVEDVQVGVLWPRLTEVVVDVDCVFELANEMPSACAAACGVPSCDDPDTVRAWRACVAPCEGSLGASGGVGNSYDWELAGAVGQTVDVQGQFPDQFTLDLLQPPPDDLLLDVGNGSRAAYGVFVALDPAGAPFEIPHGKPGAPPWLLGGSESHVLLFVPEEGVGADSALTQYLEYVPAPGYHLMMVSWDASGGDPLFAGYVPVAATDAARVQLRVDGPENVDWPYFTCGGGRDSCTFSTAFE